MRAKRTDANHRLLVRSLRQLGWQVFDLHTVPNFVDAVAHRGHALHLVEFKTDAKAPLTKSQTDLISSGWPIRIVTSLDDCVRLR